MKKIFVVFVLICLLFSACAEVQPLSRHYTSEEVDVFDTAGKYWGTYLHYFAESIAGLKNLMTDLGYTKIDPSLDDEIIVTDVTFTLSPNVTFAMKERNAAFAGTLYIKKINEQSRPLIKKDGHGNNFRVDDHGEEGDVFFLLHVRKNDKFYSGVYKEEGLTELKWHYLPEWVTQIGPIQ